MKTFNVFFLIAASLFFMSCKTQQTPLQAEQKAEKKAEQAAQQQQLFKNAVAALEANDFAVLADYVTIRNGSPIYVNPSTNFVSRQGDNATIQLAISTFRSGPNGIGGITVNGNASNTQMTTDKNGNVTYSMSVLGAAVSATVTIQLYAGNNSCVTTVYPNFSSNVIRFNGNLYNKADAFTFKGMSF